MRKLNLLLILIMTFFGLSRSYAEVIPSSPVQDGSAITEGYYVIRSNTKIQTEFSKHNYIISKNGFTKWIKSDEVNEYMIWRLISNGDGTFSMKSLQTQTYVGAVTSTSTATSSPSFAMVEEDKKNSVTIALLGQSDDIANLGEWQYNIKTKDGGIFHCEANSWQEAYVVSWNAGINSASAWCFEKVDKAVGDRWDAAFAEAVAQQGRNDAMQTLIDEATRLLSQYSYEVQATYDNILVTASDYQNDNNVITSNASEPSEGNIACLVDNTLDNGTNQNFWHSAWSTGPAEQHYLQFKLNKPVDAIAVTYWKRWNNNNYPTGFTFLVSNDAQDWKKVYEWKNLNTDKPTADNYSYTSPAFRLNGTYQYVRVLLTSNSNLVNGQHFTHLSEFWIHPVTKRTDGINQSAPDVVLAMENAIAKYADNNQITNDDLVEFGSLLDRYKLANRNDQYLQELNKLEVEGKIADEPVIGQYEKSKADALIALCQSSDATLEQIEAAYAAFKSSLNAYVFRITSAFSGYSSGCSICDDNSGTLKWSKTDTYNKQQLWKFENAKTPEITVGDYVAISVNTGRTFWDAESITVSRPTDSQPEGVYIINTKGNATPVHADQIGVIVRWNNTNANSASAWKFEYVGTSAEVNKILEEIAAQEERDERMSELITEAKAAYDSYSEYVRSEDRLIAQASQLLSNAAHKSNDPSTNAKGVWGDWADGGGYPALIDNNPSTYFHSAWQGSIAAPHYLQVAFKRPVNMYWLEYRKRNDSNRPTKFAVYGARAGADTSAVASWEYINDITLGTGSDVVSSENQMLYKNYGYLRFVVKTTNTGAVLNGYPYMAMSEFQLHPVVLDESCLNAMNPRTSGALLSALDAALCVSKATDEDIKALEDALSAYVDQMKEMEIRADYRAKQQEFFDERYASYAALLGDSIGEYHSDIFENAYIVSKRKLNAAPEDLDLAYLKNLETIMDNAVSTIAINQPESGHYYRFKNKKTGLYLSSDGTPGSVRMVDGDDVLGTTFFFSDGNKLTGSNVLNLSSVSVGTDNGTAFTFSESSVGRGLYVIGYGEDGRFWMGGNGILDAYDAESAGCSAKETAQCAWILEEVTAENEKPVFVLSVLSGYATLAVPVALNIPDGVKAYTGSLKGGKVELTEVAGGVIPAATPVIIEGDGDVVFTFASGADALEGNELQGVYADTALDSEHVYYVFSTENEPGFIQADASLGAFQAYLCGDDASVYFYPLDLGQTGIGLNTVDLEKAVIYDLSGRRVTRIVESGVYIVNGKKMVIKKAK